MQVGVGSPSLGPLFLAPGFSRLKRAAFFLPKSGFSDANRTRIASIAEELPLVRARVPLAADIGLGKALLGVRISDAAHQRGAFRSCR